MKFNVFSAQGSFQSGFGVAGVGGRYHDRRSVDFRPPGRKAQRPRGAQMHRHHRVESIHLGLGADGRRTGPLVAPHREIDSWIRSW